MYDNYKYYLCIVVIARKRKNPGYRKYEKLGR